MWWCRAAGTGALLCAAALLWPQALLAKDAEVVVHSTGVRPLATAAVDRLPRAIAVTRDESYAYIANFNADTLSILDLESLQVISGLDVADGPIALALAPDNTLLWVVNFYSNDVWVVNVVTDTVESRVTVNNGPLAIALAPDGATAYVANSFSSSISVIDEATRAVVNTLWVEDFPQALTVTPDGAHLVVAYGQSETVDLLDAATGARRARASVGSSVHSLTVVGSRVVAASTEAAHISVLDGTTLVEERRIPLARGPRSFTPGPGTDDVYVLSAEGRAITLCDVATGSARAHRLADGDYLAVARAPQRRRLLITRAEPDQVDIWALRPDGELTEHAEPRPPIAAPLEPEPEEKADLPTVQPAQPEPDMVAEDLDEPKDAGLLVAAAVPLPGEVAEPEAEPPIEQPQSAAPTATDGDSATATADEILLAAPPGYTGTRTPYPEELQPLAPQVTEGPAAPANGEGNTAPSTQPVRQGDVPPPEPALQSGPPATPPSQTRAAGRSLLARVREPLDRLRGKSASPGPAIPAWGDGEAVIAVNTSHRTLSILDPHRSAVVAEIPLPDQPHGVATSPDGRYIYVANRRRNRVLAFPRDAMDHPVEWPLEAAPGALAASEDGRRLCVVLPDINRAAVLDTATGSVVGSVATGDWPQAVVVNRAGTRAYVANQRDNSLTVLDLETPAVVATWPVGLGPVAVTLAGEEAWVAVVCSIDDSVQIFDAATGTHRATVEVGDRPEAITLAADDTTAYVANFLGSSVSAIDLTTGELKATIPTSRHPSGVALSASGEYLYVANRFADTVTILRLPSGQPVATVPVGAGPTSLHHLPSVSAG